MGIIIILKLKKEVMKNAQLKEAIIDGVSSPCARSASASNVGKLAIIIVLVGSSNCQCVRVEVQLGSNNMVMLMMLMLSDVDAYDTTAAECCYYCAVLVSVYE